MNDPAALIDWLRGIHRGIKFAILLIAAWAPFMYPRAPWVGGVLMAAMTALFFLVTSPKRSAVVRTADTSPGDIDAAP